MRNAFKRLPAWRVSSTCSVIGERVIGERVIFQKAFRERFHINYTGIKSVN